MEVFNPGQYNIGLVSNIQLGKLRNRVSFRSNAAGDSFENNSPAKLFNELEIKKMISQNPELKKILSEPLQRHSRNCSIHCKKSTTST